MKAFAVAPVALVGLALAMPTAGCAPSRGDAYDRAFAAAARAESAGRLAEAVEAYDRAVSQAKRPRDREAARWAAVDVLAREGKVADAEARLDAMAGDAASDHQAEAAYRAALLRVEDGEADRGWRDMEAVPRGFPRHGVSHVAVRRLVAHADESGTEAGLREVEALDRDLGQTELVELVTYLRVQHVEALGRDAEARDAYLKIADRWPYPYGAFFDDALWEASLLDERLGNPRGAAADLERLVAVRETTTLLGSYERARYVPAMLRLGALYRDAMHDHPRARETFHRLYTDYAHSTKRDAALWEEAGVWRADGDASTACARLSTLVHEFPDSRYVPCAVASCPGLERPSKSGAPAECHDYITRSADAKGDRAGSGEAKD